MMKLKTYQENSLKVLRRYLEQARFFGARAAYDAVQEQRFGTAKPYQALKGLVPYACLRLPTGGGKTLLGAHTVGLAGQSYLERDFPLTLWLVPTNVIQQQTRRLYFAPTRPLKHATTHTRKEKKNKTQKQRQAHEPAFNRWPLCAPRDVPLCGLCAVCLSRPL